jgi:mono/diheme cytochrome c family protein
MRKFSFACLFGLALAAAFSAPGSAADIAQGEKIAKRWCATCHVVAPDQKQASVDVPTFADAARRKSDQQLAAFLVDPHPKMPDLHLSRSEIADLVAYMRSLNP